MDQLTVSLIKNVIYGLIAYLTISWPREFLRCLFYNIFVKRYNKSERLFPLLKRSPLGYIDPIGIITFLFFDFGWTRSPVIDYIKMRRKKLFLFSLFGIVSSFILGVIYGIIAKYSNSTILFNLFYTSSKWSFTLTFVSLIPIPPLDSSRMLLAFLPNKSYEWYIKFNIYGILFLIGLLVLWVLPMIMHPLVIVITKVTNFIVFGNW
ncbi:site-2 protease family protein [Fervidobacterium sp.]